MKEVIVPHVSRFVGGLVARTMEYKRNSTHEKSNTYVHIYPAIK